VYPVCYQPQVLYNFGNFNLSGSSAHNMSLISRTAHSGETLEIA